MNISINSAKTAVVGAILLLAFAAAFVANADVTNVSATINGSDSATVAVNAPVQVAVSADKGQDGGCDNNWRSTVVSLDGNFVHEENLGSVSGFGVVNDSFDFSAPATPGEYVVLIEVMGGGESFGQTVCDDDQVWGSVELSLTVYEPVAPFIQVLSIDPKDEVRVYGDTNPLTYTAEVAIGGVPTSAHLQCVIFDIFRGDSWNTVAVDFDTEGTYDEEDGISFTYDISTYATGTYPVNVVALDVACDDLPDGFDTQDYLGTDLDETQETTLTIVDPQVERHTLTVTINGDGFGNVKTDGEVEDSIACYTEGEEQDCSGTYPEGTEITLVAAPDEGSNFNSSWSGACVGNNPVCVIVMNGAQAVNAHFALNTTPGYSQGSYGGGGNGNGVRVELTDDGDDDRDEDEDEDDRPEPEVLGESTSVVPVGAPATGAGGASASLDLSVLTAILTTRSRKEIA